MLRSINSPLLVEKQLRPNNGVNFKFDSIKEPGSVWMVNGWSSERCLEKAQLLGRSGFNRNDTQSFDMQNTEDSKDHLIFVMVKDYSLRLTSPPKNHQIGGVEKSIFFTMGILSIELTFRVVREETMEIKVVCHFLQQLLVVDRI